MKDETELTPVERKWIEASHGFQLGECIEADILIDIAEHHRRSRHYARHINHILVCPYCSSLLVDLREIEQIQKQALRQGSWWHRLRSNLVGETTSQRWGRATVAIVVVTTLLFVFKISRHPVVINDSSGRWTLNGQGEPEGPYQLPSDLRETVRKALQDNQITVAPVIDRLKGTSDVIVSPFATVVLDDKPKLEWRSQSDAVSYTCTVTSPGDTMFKLKSKKPIKDTFWRLKQPLEPGKVYTWQVTAHLRNGRDVMLTQSVASLPKFMVMEPLRVRALANDLSRYNSPLIKGLLYAQAGVMDEAQKNLEVLLLENNGSTVVRKLLNSLHLARRG